MVASILRSPGLYDPFFGDKSQKERNRARLDARFQYVLDGMLEKKWITEAEVKAAKMPLIAPRTTSGQLSGPKGYIIDSVQKELSKRGWFLLLRYGI